MSETFRLQRREDRPATIEEHAALRAEIERLRAALKPFAHAGGSKSANHNDLPGALSTISMDDLRFAFRALASSRTAALAHPEN